MTTIINGTGFDDLIEFTFMENPDADYVVFAGAGNDWVVTGDGDNTVLAGDGDDTVRTGRGDDIVSGDAGNDTIYGGRGDDQLFGGEGDDYLHGGHGNDLLVGGNGDDYILGIKGHNTISGGAGNDYISTGDHTSTVDGGADNDWINVRMKKGADHILTGGSGEDVFEFIQTAASKVSDIVITDFALGEDHFIIEGVFDVAFLNFGEMAYDLGDTEAGMVLNMGTGDSITFAGITVEDFTDHYSFGLVMAG